MQTTRHTRATSAPTPATLAAALLAILLAALLALPAPPALEAAPAFADESAEQGGGDAGDGEGGDGGKDPGGSGTETPGGPDAPADEGASSQEAPSADSPASDAAQDSQAAAEQPAAPQAQDRPAREIVEGGFKLAVIDAQTYALDGSGARQGDAAFEGMLFRVYDAKGKQVATVTANADGTVRLPDDQLLPLGTYYVQQDAASAERHGYHPDERWSREGWKVVISNPEDTVDAGYCSCEPIRGAVQLVLADADLYQAAGLAGAPQGRCSFSGASCEVYNASDRAVIVGGRLYAPYVEGSDANVPITMLRATSRGTAATGRPYGPYGLGTGLPWGTYLLKLKHAPKGYRQAGSASGGSDAYATAAVRGEGRFAPETPLLLHAERGGLSLSARDAATSDGKAQGDADFEGLCFEVVNDNAPAPGAGGDAASVVVDGKPYRRGEVICEISADAEGAAATAADALPIGTYRVRMAELSTSRCYRSDGSYTARVAVRHAGEAAKPDAKAQPHLMPVCGGVTVRDLDATTKKLLTGSVLEVVNESPRPVVTDGIEHEAGDVVLRLTSDDGVVRSSETALPYGSYSIRQAQAAQGHDADASWSAAFQVRREGFVVDAGRLFETATPASSGGRDADRQALFDILMPTVPIAVACAAAVGIAAIVISQRQLSRKGRRKRD